MTVHRERAKRLLIAPVLLLATVVAIVIAVPSLTGRVADPSAEVADLLPVVTLEDDCRRGLEPEADTDTAPVLTSERRITSTVVVACPARFDDLLVTYTGELIGDLLHRNGGAWVLVNDDAYALAVGPLPSHAQHRGTNSGLTVWLPDSLLGQVTGLGRPGQRGDIVQLSGRLQRTDPDDGGGLTLRASDLTILRPAETIHAPIDIPQALLAAVSILTSAALWTLRRRDAQRAHR